MLMISQDSPLYRMYEATHFHDDTFLMRRMYGDSREEEMPQLTSLCPFFWRIVLTFGGAQFWNVFYVVFAFSTLLGVRRAAFVIARLLRADALLTAIQAVGMFALSGIVCLVLMLVASAVIGLGWMYAKKGVKNVRRAHQRSAPSQSLLAKDLRLTWAFLVAVKGRFCPRIQLETDESEWDEDE